MSKRVTLVFIFCLSGFVCLSGFHADAAQKSPQLTDVTTLQTQRAEAHKNGDFQKSLELSRQIYETYKRDLGPDHETTINSLIPVIAAYNSLSEYQKALDLSQQMYEANKRLHGPDHILTITALQSISNEYMSLGNYQRALEISRQVYEVNQRLHGPDDPMTTTSIMGLAGIYSVLGDYQEALELERPVWEAQENICPPEKWESLEEMNAHQQKALAEQEQARKEALKRKMEKKKAKGAGKGSDEPSYQPPQDPSSDPCGPKAQMAKGTLITLADTYSKLGDYQSALKLLHRGWEAEKRFYGGLEAQKQFSGRLGAGTGGADVLVYPNQLAKIYNALGEYQKTLDVYQQVEKSVDRDMNPQYLMNQAQAYKGLGDPKKALALYQEAGESYQEKYSPEHPTFLRYLHNLARAYDDAGDHPKALELAQQAFIGQTRKLGRGHPDTAEGASLLSEIYTALGQPETSIFYARLAVESAEHQRENQKSLDAELQKSYLAKVESFYQHLAVLLIQAGRPEEALDVLRRLKINEFTKLSQDGLAVPAASSSDSLQIQSNELSDALTQTEMALAEQPKKDGTPSKAELEAQSAAAQEVMQKFLGQQLDVTSPLSPGQAAQMSKALEQMSPEQLAELAKMAKQAGQVKSINKQNNPQPDAELEARLAEAQKKFRDFLTQLPAKLGEKGRADPYQEAGRRNLAALEEIMRNMGEGAVMIYTLSSEEALYLFLATKDGLVLRQSPVGLKDMEAKVAALQPLLRSPGLDPRPAAQAIYQAVLEPLKADLAGVKTLMFSVDGALRYIPLAALYDGEKWLPEKYAVVMFTEAARDRLTPQTNFTVQAAALGLTEAKDGLAALPAVQEELDDVVKVKGEDTGVLPGVRFLNEQFNYKTLSASLKEGREVLHLASHFVFRPQVPNMSYLLLGDGSKLTIMDISQDDQLPFNKVDMLTLSACETAAGLARGNGQEVEGLAALAQKRGAATVLATLWPIADESTGRLMSDFYRLRFGEKMTKAEALRQAQLNLMQGRAPEPAGQAQTRGKATVAPVSSLVKEGQAAAVQPWTGETYAHPYFWAPFILMGNWK
jgi:CHAT domain-containing protein